MMKKILIGVDSALMHKHLGHNVIDLLTNNIAENSALLGIRFEPDESYFSQGLDPLSMVQLTPGLQHFVVHRAENLPEKDQFDTHPCYLRFYLLTTATKEIVQHYFYAVRKNITLVVLKDDKQKALQAGQQPVSKAAYIFSKPVKEAITTVLETQILILTLPCDDSVVSTRIQSTLTSILQLVDKISIQQIEPLITEARAILQDETSDLTQAKNIVCKIKERLSSVREIVPEQPRLAVLPKPEERRRKDRRLGDRRGAKRGHQPGKTLMIEQKRIDYLTNLVSEIALAKNTLPFLAMRAEQDFGARELSGEIKAQYAVIHRLSDELQTLVTQMRMVPLSAIFQRFPRLVRDLSKKLNKKVALVIEGKTLEVDKNIIEILVNPLIHLLKNSIDHGLETSTERLEKGKSEEAHLILRAMSHNDQIAIEVEDDGRGIDPELIQQKALQRKIISQEQADRFNHQQLLQLIFSPGFSTVEPLSDITSRGVGLDLVYTAVKTVGGSVTVSSEKGEGTVFRLLVPLSAMRHSVMKVEVADKYYGIIMNCVNETLKVPKNALTKHNNREVFVHREMSIPVFYLRELLQLEPKQVDPQTMVSNTDDEVAILLLTIDGNDVALVVDYFVQAIDTIIKPLEGFMQNYQYYSGAALLDNGSILLIVNIMELLASTSNMHTHQI